MNPRLLVVRGGAIGDFINTLPAIGALRERWPDAHLEILGYPHIIELANGRHYANAVRSIEARAMAGFFVPNGTLDAGLMEYFHSFNLIVSYLFDPDEVFATNVRRCGIRQLVTGSPRPSQLPAAEHYCQPLQSLAIYLENPIPRVFLGDTDRQRAAAILDPLGTGPVVAIHPGSGSEKKNWPAAKFAALARWLGNELAARLLLIKGEADDKPVAAFLPLLGNQPIIVLEHLCLPELAAVLARCALFIGNDSGITHLAAAVGTPTIAFFGPASPAIWQPRGPNVHVIPFGDSDTARARQLIAKLWPQA